MVDADGTNMHPVAEENGIFLECIQSQVAGVLTCNDLLGWGY